MDIIEKIKVGARAVGVSKILGEKALLISICFFCVNYYFCKRIESQELRNIVVQNDIIY